MKRLPELQDLSREHHKALVLALRIARAKDLVCRDDLMLEVSELFHRELEPHFIIEETTILPQLAQAGHHEMVKHTEDDHRCMRELALRISNGDHAALALFGEILKEHVRFEERELFPVTESVLFM